MSVGRTILKISGGAGSWAAGRKWRDENPGASLELLFTDTLCEGLPDFHGDTTMILTP